MNAKKLNKNTDAELPTHRDLTPKDLCPAMIMKQILTHQMDEKIYDYRDRPGDGYYWCLRTCTEIGPDDQIVDVDDCRPGRGCYEGLKL